MGDGRPSRTQILMAHAALASARGTCPRKSVGVVIARDGRILSTGYNGAPKGLPHCQHQELSGHNLKQMASRGQFTETISRVEVYDNIIYDVISAGSEIVFQSTAGHRPTCPFAVHAEANAIAFAARHGLKTENTELYTTMNVCLDCAKLVINAGIGVVVAAEDYRDTAGANLLRAAGVRLELME